MLLDPHYTVRLTQAVNNSSAREQALTNELSSGVRVSRLSDDPLAASLNVQLSGSISRMDSFVRTSTREQSMLQATDIALGQVVSQVTSALSLAVSAGNATLSSSNLSAIQKQVADIRDNVVALGNTSYLGQYVFSGSQGDTRPFQLDASTNPATATYHGDQVTQQVQTPDGQAVQVNVPGSSIFTSSSADLLGALNQLVSHLASGSAAAVQGDTSALSSALSNVSTQRTAIGSSLNRLTTASGYAGSQQAALLAQQSALLSADPASVASDLKTVEVQHQALLGIEAALTKVSLFDYLK
jgi:flagellar hook-associated protein 3 FlgL